MKDKVILVGGGGHAKVLIDAIRSQDRYIIKGITDPALKVGERILGIPVLGSDEVLKRMRSFRGRPLLAVGIASVRASKKRKELYEALAASFEFPPIIHKRAYVARGAKLECGVQVMSGAIIQPDAEIGKNSIVNTSAVIEHDCRIGPHSHVSIGAILGGFVSVGECSHVGMGAKILQGIRVGKHVTVGAGAVVTKDVKDGRTVVGIPARKMYE